jgi:formylglycine-generating enzyme required for sulfatase activity
LWGARVGFPCRRADESQHQVKLTRRFEIQSTEVTQEQFAALMGYLPLSSCGPPCPVVNVSWSEAAAYCNALSLKAKLEPCYACTGTAPAVVCTVAAAYRTPAKPVYACPGYRLPTEAEWEYAYRAGTSTALYNGPFGAACATDPNASQIGWYRANAGNDIHLVGQKSPNAWGLYDMAGNAIELVHDFYVENLGTTPVVDPVHEATPERWHMIRGGSFSEDADRMRAARRDHCDSSPTSSDVDIGFRVVRTLP